MRVPAWTEDYLGIPYVEKGRSKEGLDCWGLVMVVMKEQFDVSLPAYDEAYTDMCEEEEVRAIIAGDNTWEKLDSPEVGAVIWIRHLGHIAHVGVMVTPRYFLHTFPPAGTCITAIDNHQFANRIRGYFRWKGSND